MIDRHANAWRLGLPLSQPHSGDLMRQCIAIRHFAFEGPGTFEPLLRMCDYKVMMIEGP